MGNVISLMSRRTESELEREVNKIISALRASGIDGIDPIFELVCVCRNPGHIVDELYGVVLKNLGLMEPDGTVGDRVRKIVLDNPWGI